MVELQSVFTVVKAIVGSGILALPNSVQSVGWIAAFIGLFIVAIFSDFTMRYVVLSVKYLRKSGGLSTDGLGYTSLDDNIDEKLDSTDNEEEIEFDEIAQITLGSIGRWIAISSLLITQLGSCACYLIFLINRGQEVFSSFNLTRLEIMGFLSPILIILVLLRTTKLLAPTALLGNISVLIGIISVFVYGFKDGENPAIGDRTAFDFGGLPSFFGVSCFIYSAHCEAVSIEQSSRDKKNFPKVIQWSMYFIYALYVLFGIGGYYFFGEQLSGDTNIFSLMHGNAAKVVKMCVCISLLFQFPITLFPAATLFESFLGVKQQSKDDVEEQTSFMKLYFSGTELVRSAVRLLTLAVLCITALYVKGFGTAVAFSGFANAFVAFVLPPLFYLKAKSGTLGFSPSLNEVADGKERCSSFEVVFCWFMVVFGVVGAIYGTVTTILDSV
eukprot:TRINITY_DN31821_c0_g1_i1.p1 TRINITY_DN31821_c0_g1~~TRINITY_DN31821_c0_g1_i1.p1  ORF type:complete len:442 (-),score=121.69 TRINITY_DN31821_c0_g1_i1:168-1493(-)